MFSKRKKSRINAVPGATCKAGGSQKRYYIEALRANRGPIPRECANLEVFDMMKKAPNRPFGELGGAVAGLAPNIPN